MHRHGAIREHRGSSGSFRTVRTGTMLGPPGAMSVVEIKIADKYVAPSPMSVPLQFNAYCQSPVDSVPVYSFELERGVLLRAENRRRAEESDRRLKQEAQAAAEASAAKPASAMMSSGILEPERPGASQAVAADANSRTNPAGWSLRDFETQATDPFEMAELKTIDVMAELSNVFPSQSAAVPCSMSPAGTPGVPTTGGLTGTVADATSAIGDISAVNGLPATIIVTTLASATPAVATADPRQQHPMADVRPIPRPRTPVPGTPVPAAAPTTLGLQQQHQLGQPVPGLPYPVNDGGNSPVRGPSPPSPAVPAGGALVTTTTAAGPVPRPRPRLRAPVPQPPTAGSPVAGLPMPLAGSTSPTAQQLPGASPHSPTSHVNPITTGAAVTVRQQPVLHPVTTAARTTAVTMVSAAAENPEGPPPSYQASVPTSSAAASAAPPVSGDGFPPPYPMQPPPADTRLPKRQAPPPPYMVANGGSESGITAAGYVHSDYSLPDVYSQLKRQERKQVDQLKQMGFPQDRLSRAFQRLGGDQAKVLEFLFQINKFGEPPHHFPPDSAETALINNDCSEEKALVALKLTFELKEMGFSERAIHAALKESHNKKDAAIDHLITSTT